VLIPVDAVNACVELSIRISPEYHMAESQRIPEMLFDSEPDCHQGYLPTPVGQLAHNAPVQNQALLSHLGAFPAQILQVAAAHPCPLNHDIHAPGCARRDHSI